MNETGKDIQRILAECEEIAFITYDLGGEMEYIDNETKKEREWK